VTGRPKIETGSNSGGDTHNIYKVRKLVSNGDTSNRRQHQQLRWLWRSQQTCVRSAQRKNSQTQDRMPTYNVASVQQDFQMYSHYSHTYKHSNINLVLSSFLEVALTHLQRSSIVDTLARKPLADPSSKGEGLVQVLEHT